MGKDNWIEKQKKKEGYSDNSKFTEFTPLPVDRPYGLSVLEAAEALLRLSTVGCITMNEMREEITYARN